MSSREPKRKLSGTWRSLHVVIWVIGIYILYTRGSFFPGILILIAISALYEAAVQRFVPQAYIEEKPAEVISPAPAAAAPIAPSPQARMQAPAARLTEHRIELLPQVCPSCNAPIRGHEVRWTGPQSANCPYCGTNLPMNKA